MGVRYVITHSHPTLAALCLLVAILLGVNAGWLVYHTTPTACVRFAEASNDLLRFTRSLATASQRAAQAAVAGNAERLGRATTHLSLLGSDFNELGPRLLEMEGDCVDE